jgi:hypothetical protein
MKNTMKNNNDIMPHMFRMLAIVLLILGVQSCGLKQETPAQPTGFTGGVAMSEHQRYPFDRVWVPSDSKQLQANRAKYNKVIIAPVNTRHLAQMPWLRQQSAKRQADVMQDAIELGQFFRKELQNGYRTNSRFDVVNEVGPGTVYMELAIVELRPSRAWINRAGAAAGFIVPGASVAMGVFTERGYIAIEGRFRDAQTGKLIALMADKEADRIRLINLAKLSWYQNSKDHLSIWAKQLVALTNTSFDTKVKDASKFTLRPW